MNAYQTQLFDDLNNLVVTKEAFYKQQFELDGLIYWIYNYRLASYSDFQTPNALECRGHMFEVDTKGNAIRLATLPPEKFFNLNENPFTMGLDLTKVKKIESKADGSIMSTYIHNDQLRLKSKGSLFSTQAVDAMAWLDLQSNGYLKQLLQDFTFNGITVNLEWVAPYNRIVLGYLEPSLIVLNARDNDTGEYADTWIFGDHNISSVDVNGITPVDFVASIPNMVDIEGYVIQLESGQRVKIKTNWYLTLHHAKDSINNPRRLFEAILEEGIDDLLSLFFEDMVAMKMIDEMQLRVDHLYNHMVKVVEHFYETNKDLDRKSYAIKGQEEMERIYFGLAMTKYQQKPIDYKAFLRGKWKELGFNDEKTEE